MTLLEALLALVILGLSAVGYLEVFQSSARSAADAGEWTQVVAAAEATMERTLAGAPGTIADRADVTPSRIDIVPFGDDLSQVVVTVTSTRGIAFSLRRVVRNSRLARTPRSP